jgi:hypothetical protein
MLGKILRGVLFFVAIMGVVFFMGRISGVKSICSTVNVYNGGSSSIMTAEVEHETGSSIAASIKKKRTRKIRILVRDSTAFSLKATFENNKTVYSQKIGPIKTGNEIKLVVTDSTITPQ